MPRKGLLGDRASGVRGSRKLGAIKRQVALGMLLGAPSEPADLGPGGVPEEEHDAFDQHVGHPDQVQLPAVAGIEGILDLLSLARGLLQHEFLGVVSSVALLCHENLPFRGLLEMRSISSLPNAEQLFSCPVFLFTELPSSGLLGNRRGPNRVTSTKGELVTYSLIRMGYILLESINNRRRRNA